MGKLYWRDVGLAMGSFLAVTYVWHLYRSCVRAPIQLFPQEVTQTWIVQLDML